jgi:hypothetical protein
MLLYNKGARLDIVAGSRRRRRYRHEESGLNFPSKSLVVATIRIIVATIE